MIIKIKGTDKPINITPLKWADIVKNGNADQYEIIERNTVWIAKIDSSGRIDKSTRREVELNQWHRLLEAGSNNSWRKVKPPISQSFLVKFWNSRPRLKTIYERTINSTISKFTSNIITTFLGGILILIVWAIYREQLIDCWKYLFSD